MLDRSTVTATSTGDLSFLSSTYRPNSASSSGAKNTSGVWMKPRADSLPYSWYRSGTMTYFLQTTSSVCLLSGFLLSLKPLAPFAIRYNKITGMQLGRIMSMQMSINCLIRHCIFSGPVPWAAMQSSRAAKRDVIGYNNFASWIIVEMSSSMLMRLQKFCQSCASLVERPVILLWIKVAKFLHSSCARVLFYFILLQMGEPF